MLYDLDVQGSHSNFAWYRARDTTLEKQPGHVRACTSHAQLAPTPCTTAAPIMSATLLQQPFGALPIPVTDVAPGIKQRHERAIKSKSTDREKQDHQHFFSSIHPQKYFRNRPICIIVPRARLYIFLLYLRGTSDAA